MDDVRDLGDIDRLVHEPGRLMILAVLNGVEEADFLFLMVQTGPTKGNLSSHVSKLEVAGYVDVQETFVDKVPRTVYRLTPGGDVVLRGYRRHISAVLASLEP